MKRVYLLLLALVLAPPAAHTQLANGGMVATRSNLGFGGVRTPQDFNASAGSGGDDSTAINTAITQLAADGGGTLFLPDPSSGAYNVCASTVTLPLLSSLVVRGASTNTTIRVLPGCSTPPTSVLTLGDGQGLSAYRIHLENLRLDGYCVAAHDLDIGYARGFSAENVVFRNVKPVSGDVGSNIRIENATQNGTLALDTTNHVGWVSFELRIGASNLIENMNDTGHTCYSSTSDLPAYNLEAWGGDSDYTGLIAVNAAVSNFYEGAGGADNHFGEGTHGWGSSLALSPQYTFWLSGASIVNSAVADDFTVAGVRLSGSAATVTGTQFIARSPTLIGVLLDAGVANSTITGNQLNWFTPTTQVVQTGGDIDKSNVVQNNVGGVVSAPASPENRIINPDFAIDSYHGGSATTGLSGFFQDRWEIFENYAQYYQRNPNYTSTGCPGGKTGLTLVDSGNQTPPSNSYSALIQPVDGAELGDLFMGNATYGQGFEFSFWASADTAGTYSIAFFNGSWTRSLVATVTLGTTCAYHSLMIPPDLGGTGANSWNDASGQTAMLVGFDLGSGSNYQTSNTWTWQNGLYLEATGSQQIAANLSGKLNLTAVRLRKGQADVARIPRSFFDEWGLARQFRRSTFPVGLPTLTGTAPAQNAGVTGALCFRAPSSGSYGSVYWSFDLPMRKKPTVTTYNPSAANANWRDVTAGADVTVSVDPSSAGAATGVEITGGAVGTGGDNVCVHAVADVGY